jgi:molybdenum cofactor cytidylyltransferase
MGRTKQLLPWGNSTIIEQVVSNTLESKVDEVIVVLGYQADSIAPRIADKPVKVVLNRDYHQGISSSIRCGLDFISEDSDGVMIVLGDQPLIGKETINKLVEEFAKSRHGIAAPVYRRRIGHPVIFAARYKPELSRLAGDVGAKKIIESHPDDILEVEASSESIFIDIDNERDYRSQNKASMDE